MCFDSVKLLQPSGCLGEHQESSVIPCMPVWLCGAHPYVGLWGEKVHSMLDRRTGCEQVRYKDTSERESVKTSHIL